MKWLTKLLYPDYYAQADEDEPINVQGFGTGVVEMKPEVVDEILSNVDWDKVGKLIKENWYVQCSQ